MLENESDKNQTYENNISDYITNFIYIQWKEAINKLLFKRKKERIRKIPQFQLREQYVQKTYELISDQNRNLPIKKVTTVTLQKQTYQTN